MYRAGNDVVIREGAAVMAGRLATERRNRILEAIRQSGSVSAADMARDLGVSVMTIRRDLALMDKEGLIERCHGGAVIQNEVSYSAKRERNREGKEKIADVCAAMVGPGMKIYLDAGTTTWEIARRIRNTKNLTVLTNDLEIARLLTESDVNLFMLGGQVQNATGSIWGYFATEMIKDFNFDLGFFGASSIDDHLQITTPTTVKAFLKREAAERCSIKVLSADSSKFGGKSVIAVNRVGDYDVIVTDHPLREEEKRILSEQGTQVITV